MSVTILTILPAQLNKSKVFRRWTYDVINLIKPNREYSGFNNSHGRFWSSENRKENHDDKLAVTIINRQLRSYVDSYDHASRSIVCSYDHCIGAVTIILLENKTTISLILHVNRAFCLVTDDDKSHIYTVCKLSVPPWHASITIRSGPNSPSPTSAILYDRNCNDRNCFPTVTVASITDIVILSVYSSQSTSLENGLRLKKSIDTWPSNESQ